MVNNVTVRSGAYNLKFDPIRTDNEFYNVSTENTSRIEHFFFISTETFRFYLFYILNFSPEKSLKCAHTQ